MLDAAKAAAHPAIAEALILQQQERLEDRRRRPEQDH